MKVLVFTSLFPNNISPNHGVFIKERMRQVASLDGCMVKVAAPVPYHPAIKIGWRHVFSRVTRHEVIEGLEIYHPRYFMTPKVGMASYGLTMFLSVLPTVRKIQRDFNFDMIDAHYVYPDGFAAVLLGRFFRKPVVVSARGSDINLFVKLPVIRRLLQYTLHRADRLISVCQALRDEIVQLGIPDDKISVIPNGVDSDKFYPCPKREARGKLGLPMDKKLILSIGGLIPGKGFDLLIKALKIFFNEFPEKNLHLVIIGEGKFRRELERLVFSLNLGEHVYLAGIVPHQELFLWYSASDVFCLASSSEGWPNVLMESLACGTPVVATTVGGIPEVIRSDKMGLLVKRNERELAEGIYNALKRPWRPDEIIQYARDNTWDRVALSVFQVFESLLDRNGLK